MSQHAVEATITDLQQQLESKEKKLSSVSAGVFFTYACARECAWGKGVPFVCAIVVGGDVVGVERCGLSLGRKGSFKARLTI